MKISNVSLSASAQDIKEFFSFSGDIEHVELQRFILLIIIILFYHFLVLNRLNSPYICNSADEWSQIAYVTFRDSQGAETALLLSVRLPKTIISFSSLSVSLKFHPCIPKFWCVDTVSVISLFSLQIHFTRLSFSPYLINPMFAFKC